MRHPEITRHVVESAGSADEVVPELRKAKRDYVVSDEMASRLGMNEAERAAVQALRRRGMTGLVAKSVSGDGAKQQRARIFIAPAADAGDVHLIAAHSYVPLLLEELTSFPNGAHDDQVDAMSLAFKHLGKGSASASAPKGQTPQPKAGAEPTPVRPADPRRGASVVAPRGRLQVRPR